MNPLAIFKKKDEDVQQVEVKRRVPPGVAESQKSASEMFARQEAHCKAQQAGYSAAQVVMMQEQQAQHLYARQQAVRAQSSQAAAYNAYMEKARAQAQPGPYPHFTGLNPWRLK